jgi:lysophospholipase L1-like esterase
MNLKSRIFEPTFFKSYNSFPRLFCVMATLCLALISCSIFAAPPTWVGTWSTAPQQMRSNDMPPSPGLTNNSLRQVVRVSIGGSTIRLRFSNEFSPSAVTMKSVQIAVSVGGSTINVSTNKELKFNGKPEVTMEAGNTVTSDPIAFKLVPGMVLAITINFGQTSATMTGHPGSRTTSYLLAGNTAAKADFTGAAETDHWYCINAIDIQALSTAGCIAVLGNSITDGRGTTTNKQNRWTDILSERLLANRSTKHVGVLNLGIGGNSVVGGGLGQPGALRYERDILNQSGVRWAIVFEGVNDIGAIRTSEAAVKTTNNLIAAYKLMIDKAHNKNIRIYGATIPPFKGNSYYNQYSDSSRNAINEWIRHSGYYDGVIDFCKTMADPQDTTMITTSYQNDHLHPDAAGYKKMGESVDLKLFIGGNTIFQRGKNKN